MAKANTVHQKTESDHQPESQLQPDNHDHEGRHRTVEDHQNSPEKHEAHGGHGGHGAHTDHGGHEMMFRNRFWVSLALSVPVLLYSEMLQMWLGFSMPAFPGSQWIGPLFAIIVFMYGGIPFLQMAVPELKNRQPGMMTLISLAISVAFFYSIATLFAPLGSSFFWELVTLIDVMLLGHWLEMRSVRQASGALNELAKLMPDTAERLTAEGGTETVKISQLKRDDKVLVRPGASNKGTWVRLLTVPVEGKLVSGFEGMDVGQKLKVKLVRTDVERGYIDFERVR